ncbi:hypothetical protein ACH427_19055 [Streptomyces sp. NPDC020379]|uniref:hypothetical protein n=1 Tax=Streptomyces sp. NPDC020379 TaxID=3365071 RepID=UPI003789C57B
MALSRVQSAALTTGALLTLTMSVGTISQASAQASSSASVTAAPPDCPKHYFCGYKYANFKKLAFKFQDCGYMQEIPNGLNSGGSWYNNQTKGLMAAMFNKNRDWIFSTDPAPSNDAHGDWAPVWYVQAC